jgi:CheY-like chemotaxis protein
MATNHQLPVILICEDDPDDLYFARLLVQRSGTQKPVVSVENGEEAVTYLTGCIHTGHLPCIVFLDIKMPLLGGFGVLEWAKAQPALANVAFLMMSGSDLDADRARAAELGAADYVVKYPSPQRLGELIVRYCRS